MKTRTSVIFREDGEFSLVLYIDIFLCSLLCGEALKILRTTFYFEIVFMCRMKAVLNNVNSLHKSL